jgi:hypothetical protein
MTAAPDSQVGTALNKGQKPSDAERIQTFHRNH